MLLENEFNSLPSQETIKLKSRVLQAKKQHELNPKQIRFYE